MAMTVGPTCWRGGCSRPTAPTARPVLNRGTGRHQAAGPAESGSEKPFPGGPAAGQRLERDVLGLSGVTTLIWLEGINDFSRNGNASVEKVQSAMREVVA